MSRSLSQTAARIRPPVFSELQTRIDRLAASGQEIVPLQIGDTFLLPPERARKILAELQADDASLYRYGATAGLAPLREAFAKRLRAHGREVDPANEVHVGNGGTHALFCAARALLDDGDEVLLASPWWPLAPGIFTSCGAINVEVPLTQRLYEDPALDVAAAFSAKITPRTKAIYFISPNNPDGKVLGRFSVEGLGKLPPGVKSPFTWEEMEERRRKHRRERDGRREQRRSGRQRRCQRVRQRRRRRAQRRRQRGRERR